MANKALLPTHTAQSLPSFHHDCKTKEYRHVALPPEVSTGFILARLGLAALFPVTFYFTEVLEQSVF